MRKQGGLGLLEIVLVLATMATAMCVVVVVHATPSQPGIISGTKFSPIANAKIFVVQWVAVGVTRFRPPPPSV